MKVQFKGRPVEVCDVNYGSDSVDTFVTSAIYLDGDEEDLSEDELITLTDQLYQDGDLEQLQSDHYWDLADDAYERYRDAEMEKG